MSIKLDKIDLSKPSASAEGEKNKDIRTILRIEINDKRNLAELQIPGSSGNILQDMGADPVFISLEGEFSGEKASDIVQDLYSKYESGKPIPFYSDLSALADVSKVLISNLKAEQVVGSISRYHYKIDLHESRA